eukprot:g17897.t1
MGGQGGAKGAGKGAGKGGGKGDVDPGTPPATKKIWTKIGMDPSPKHDSVYQDGKNLIAEAQKKYKSVDKTSDAVWEGSTFLPVQKLKSMSKYKLRPVADVCGCKQTPQLMDAYNEKISIMPRQQQPILQARMKRVFGKTTLNPKTGIEAKVWDGLKTMTARIGDKVEELTYEEASRPEDDPGLQYITKERDDYCVTADVAITEITLRHFAVTSFGQATEWIVQHPDWVAMSGPLTILKDKIVDANEGKGLSANEVKEQVFDDAFIAAHQPIEGLRPETPAWKAYLVMKPMINASAAETLAERKGDELIKFWGDNDAELEPILQWDSLDQPELIYALFKKARTDNAFYSHLVYDATAPKYATTHPTATALYAACYGYDQFKAKHHKSSQAVSETVHRCLMDDLKHIMEQAEKDVNTLCKELNRLSHDQETKVTPMPAVMARLNLVRDGVREFNELAPPGENFDKKMAGSFAVVMSLLKNVVTLAYSVYLMDNSCITEGIPQPVCAGVNNAAFNRCGKQRNEIAVEYINTHTGPEAFKFMEGPEGKILQDLAPFNSTAFNETWDLAEDKYTKFMIEEKKRSAEAMAKHAGVAPGGLLEAAPGAAGHGEWAAKASSNVNNPLMKIRAKVLAKNKAAPPANPKNAPAAKQAQPAAPGASPENEQGGAPIPNNMNKGQHQGSGGAGGAPIPNNMNKGQQGAGGAGGAPIPDNMNKGQQGSGGAGGAPILNNMNKGKQGSGGAGEGKLQGCAGGGKGNYSKGVPHQQEQAKAGAQANANQEQTQAGQVHPFGELGPLGQRISISTFPSAGRQPPPQPGGGLQPKHSSIPPHQSAFPSGSISAGKGVGVSVAGIGAVSNIPQQTNVDGPHGLAPAGSGPMSMNEQVEMGVCGGAAALQDPFTSEQMKGIVSTAGEAGPPSTSGLTNTGGPAPMEIVSEHQGQPQHALRQQLQTNPTPSAVNNTAVLGKGAPLLNKKGKQQQNDAQLVRMSGDAGGKAGNYNIKMAELQELARAKGGKPILVTASHSHPDQHATMVRSHYPAQEAAASPDEGAGNMNMHAMSRNLMMENQQLLAQIRASNSTDGGGQAMLKSGQMTASTSLGQDARSMKSSLGSAEAGSRSRAGSIAAGGLGLRDEEMTPLAGSGCAAPANSANSNYLLQEQRSVRPRYHGTAHNTKTWSEMKKALDEWNARDETRMSRMSLISLHSESSNLMTPGGVQMQVTRGLMTPGLQPSYPPNHTMESSAAGVAATPNFANAFSSAPAQKGPSGQLHPMHFNQEAFLANRPSTPAMATPGEAESARVVGAQMEAVQQRFGHVLSRTSAQRKQPAGGHNVIQQPAAGPGAPWGEIHGFCPVSDRPLDCFGKELSGYEDLPPGHAELLPLQTEFWETASGVEGVAAEPMAKQAASTSIEQVERVHAMAKRAQIANLNPNVKGIPGDHVPSATISTSSQPPAALAAVPGAAAGDHHQTAAATATCSAGEFWSGKGGAAGGQQVQASVLMDNKKEEQKHGSSTAGADTSVYCPREPSKESPGTALEQHLYNTTGLYGESQGMCPFGDSQGVFGEEAEYIMQNVLPEGHPAIDHAVEEQERELFASGGVMLETASGKKITDQDKISLQAPASPEPARGRDGIHAIPHLHRSDNSSSPVPKSQLFDANPFASSVNSNVVEQSQPGGGAGALVSSGEHYVLNDYNFLPESNEGTGSKRMREPGPSGASPEEKRFCGPSDS